jgi:hypothetical protein
MALVVRADFHCSTGVLAAARDHRQSVKNPPKSVEAYLGALEKLGLAGTVAALRPFAALLA